ncbi:tetratricopeptide repeat protein [Massilia sp. YIM B02769]|uniref:tetratricopeptide repeat protein n=1 Tax=Massilia sp. YIM B02769 TaxID=3050129 RepID=UPI0025B72E16|nr:tetratricopeptide repeat protein [Massilia sp. YIM B02769]MDN4058872.1 tetratricopeptide repeat protein [Massilia sp. YIM B02769]
MEINRLTLPPIPRPGEVTTFYSFEHGAARSIALAHAAVQLAAGQNATVPVLMIDWDTEAPGLHHYFPTRDERFEDPRPDFRPDARATARAAAARPGLLEYFEACGEQLQQLQQLQSLGRAGADLDHEERARLVLEAIDWEAHLERVDQSRSLYLMRAGRFDDSYGERADRMDWDGLFTACPALYRAFAAHLARHFRHVLIDARCGRSAAVSVCTTLLPDRLVGLFTPGGRSLDGLGGVVTRAVEYRCSHEDEQRPLLVYPLPCGLEGADPERRALWRRGDPQRGIPGYQPALEQLLRNCYGLSQLSLDSYLDEVPLLACGAPGELLGASAMRDADCHAPARSLAALLGWLDQGRFPWQSRAELDLLDAIAASRAALAAGGQGAGMLDPNAAPLARDLLRLGELQRAQGRSAQAQDSFEESTALRQRLFGDSHPDTRASRSALAALLRDSGRLRDARAQYELLLEHCLLGAGEEHAETLAARSGLAATLAQVEEFPRALALHESVVEACERLYGPGHIATLDALAGQARTLARQGEYSRARMVYERVLEGRQRILGTEHEDTLRCTQLLATLLRDMGDLGNARKLQEGVLRVRERQSGPDAAATLQAREALAEIFAAQGDLGAVREMQQSLATARERRLGSEHPDTLSILLRLASTLSEQGELEEARRLQQHVVSLHERLRGMDDHETLRSKQMLARTLSSQGHSQAARRLEASVEEGSSRLLNIRAMSAGPHDAPGLAPAGAAGALVPGRGAGMAGGATARAGGTAASGGVADMAPRAAPARSAGRDGSRDGPRDGSRDGARDSAHEGRRDGLRDASPAAPHDLLEHKLSQLQKLVDARRGQEARALADSLRETILRPHVAQALRRRGVALIKQVYLDDGDKDALLAFTEDEVASLEGALIEAAGGRPVALR